MSRNPLSSARLAADLDWLAATMARRKAQFGGWTMEATGPPVERPDDIPEADWDALGDPGKQALVRERARAASAEEQVAALRAELAKAAKPAPPKPTDPPKPDPKPGDQPDVAKLVQDAVAAAIKPFQEAETQRQAEVAAGKVRDAVVEAAKSRLHDSSDAVANIDMTKVVDDQGAADPAKITAELDDLVKRKPHLAKSATLVAPPGIGGGGPASTTDAEKVKAILADMQKATGLRTAAGN